MTLTLDVKHAADRFRSLAGLGDNGVRYAAGRNQPGKCTRWVYFAVSDDGQGFENTSPLPSAIAAWNNAPPSHRHPLTEKPFAGAVLVYGALPGPRWAGDRNYMYGDVVVLDGTGFESGDWQPWGTVGTDAAGVGVIADVSAGTRYIQTGRRPVLGWLSSYGGAVLAHGKSIPATPTAPATPLLIRKDPDTMRISWNENRTIATLRLADGRKWKVVDLRVSGERVGGRKIVDLLQRLINSDQTKQYPVVFNNQENAIIDAALSLAK